MRQLAKNICTWFWLLLFLSSGMALADSLPVSLQQLGRAAAETDSDSLRCQYYAQLSAYYRLQSAVQRQRKRQAAE